MALAGTRLNSLQPPTGISPLKQPIAPGKGAAEIADSFSEVLGQALSNLEQQQQQVRALNEGFITGQGVDVHTLMIASEKAQLGLQLTVQVRNKVIEAYQEIMRTQL